MQIKIVFKWVYKIGVKIKNIFVCYLQEDNFNRMKEDKGIEKIT